MDSTSRKKRRDLRQRRLIVILLSFLISGTVFFDQLKNEPERLRFAYYKIVLKIEDRKLKKNDPTITEIQSSLDRNGIISRTTHYGGSGAWIQFPTIEKRPRLVTFDFPKPEFIPDNIEVVEVNSFRKTSLQVDYAVSPDKSKSLISQFKKTYSGNEESYMNGRPLTGIKLDPSWSQGLKVSDGDWSSTMWINGETGKVRILAHRFHDTDLSADDIDRRAIWSRLK